MRLPESSLPLEQGSASQAVKNNGIVKASVIQSEALPVTETTSSVLPDGVVEGAMPTVEVAAEGADFLGVSSDSAVFVEPVFSWGGYFMALGVVCALIGLLWFAVWFLKKRGRPGLFGVDNIVLESRFALGPKNSLLIVRIDRRRLLLGVTEQHVELVAELDSDFDGHGAAGAGIENTLPEEEGRFKRMLASFGIKVAG